MILNIEKDAPIQERIIGEYIGHEHGVMMICFGAMHGNEPAGVLALERLFKMLADEPAINPSFNFKGCLLGIIGNLSAYRQRIRYQEKDLNRQWTKEHTLYVRQQPDENLAAEDLELKQLLLLIDAKIKAYQPTHLVVMDLHTTSAEGGIFSIPADNNSESIELARSMHAPVIQGLLNGIDGTTLHYFNSENMSIKTTAVSFESGQHDDTLSINRSIAGIINCLRTVGCLAPEDVENKHDNLLRTYSENLPKVTRIIGHHHIQEGDNFLMVPNYRNFQVLKKNEILAYDKHGPITAPYDCMILMPLYQKKGNDGFFLVQEEGA